MRHRIPWVVFVAVAACIAMPLCADDLSEADAFLCAAIQATGCTLEDECVMATPFYWNVPQFIEIDLDKRVLRTTKASGALRSTPIRFGERGNGLILLQGVEGGRAFSFVIAEATGDASVAIARDGVTMGVFGSCTPLPE